MACAMLFVLTGCASDESTTYYFDSSSSKDSSSSSDSDSSEVELPDPGSLLDVEGEYNTTDTDNDGVIYDYYTYDFSAKITTVSNFIVTYGEALKDMGFTVKSLNTTSSYNMKYMSYTKDGKRAELAVFVGGSSDGSSIDEDSVLVWRIVLCIPEGMSFTLGSSVPGTLNGDTKCVGCDGTGICSGCGGIGKSNYGDGYETCILCDGTGTCNICDGEGSY